MLNTPHQDHPPDNAPQRPLATPPSQALVDEAGLPLQPHRGDSLSTERGQERAREDAHYTPVIIKRSDAVLRHPDDILELAIAEGVEQMERPSFSLALSSVAAGLILGFTVMAVAVVTQALAPLDAPLLTRLGTALVYPLGFVICIISGTQLFTEQTATAVYPVLDGYGSVRNLGRLWGTVVVGNVAGAFVSASLLILADDVIGARDGYIAIGEHLTHFATPALLVSAVLAGWLMAQGGWLVMATPSASGQFLSIYIVTFLIGVGGLHHSIAGSVEIFAALLVDPHVTLLDAGRFIGVALLGNLLGGSLFVALLNYAHIRKTRR